MVDVKGAKCTQKGCRTRPIYNYENETKGLYCSVHKKDGMVNVRRKWRIGAQRRVLSVKF